MATNKRDRLTPAVLDDMIQRYKVDGMTGDELVKYLKVKHGITMSRRLVGEVIRQQMEARSIASIRAIGPKLELVMDDQIDKLLKFQNFCLDNALEIWRNLPDRERNTAKNAFKFFEGFQKSQAQTFIVNGMSEAAKAGQTMDDISHKLDKKLEKLMEAVNSTDEDTQPEGEK